MWDELAGFYGNGIVSVANRTASGSRGPGFGTVDKRWWPQLVMRDERDPVHRRLRQKPKLETHRG